MTKKEIRSERKAAQKLIGRAQDELYRELKKSHPKLIKMIKKRFDADKYHLTDADYYEEIEHDLA